MNAKLPLLLAVVSAACATPSSLVRPVSVDPEFTLDVKSCECRNAAGQRGYNVGYVGECGLLGDDSVADPDQRVSALWSDFSDADLSGKNLRGVVLRGAMLKNANFKGADLTCADFQWAFVKGAQFASAKLQFASFRHAYTYKADFANTDLRGAYAKELPRGLTVKPEQVAGAVVDATTELAER